MQRVGVLALQGDFREHLLALQSVGVEAVPVRLPAQLAGLDGVVVPGGESTTMRKLLAAYSLAEPLGALVREGLPAFGTCAGSILLAREVDGIRSEGEGLLDISVRRNAYGSQVHSFEASVDAPVLGDPAVRGIFIRAPRIERVGPDVAIVGRLPDGEVVAVRQGPLLATTFHPELAGDLRFHAYFVEHLVRARRERMAV
jgi:5'-phosphate synthase pdxT subunit